MLGRPLEQVKERACEGKERFTTSDWVGVESHVNLGEAGSRPQGSLGKEKGRCRARGERTRQQGQEAVDSVAPYRAIVGFQLSLCLTWRVAKFSFVQMYQDRSRRDDWKNDTLQQKESKLSISTYLIIYAECFHRECCIQSS